MVTPYFVRVDLGLSIRIPELMRLVQALGRDKAVRQDALAAVARGEVCPQKPRISRCRFRGRFYNSSDEYETCADYTSGSKRKGKL